MASSKEVWVGGCLGLYMRAAIVVPVSTTILCLLADLDKRRRDRAGWHYLPSACASCTKPLLFPPPSFLRQMQ